MQHTHLSDLSVAELDERIEDAKVAIIERLRRKRRGGVVAIPSARLDRLARLAVAFPKGRRDEIAARVGLSKESLKGIAQGRVVTHPRTARRICNLFPRVLCINDLVSIPDEGVNESVALHRIDLPVALGA